MTADPITALKRELVREILSAVAHFNSTMAAMALEIDASRFADLRNGRAARFSIERLIRMLASIDHHVDIHVTAPAVRITLFRLARNRRDRSGYD